MLFAAAKVIIITPLIDINVNRIVIISRIQNPIFILINFDRHIAICMQSAPGEEFCVRHYVACTTGASEIKNKSNGFMTTLSTVITPS